LYAIRQTRPGVESWWEREARQCFAGFLIGPGDKITWEVRGGRVAVTTDRPLLWELEGFIKHGEPDAVKAVAAARKMRGRI